MIYWFFGYPGIGKDYLAEKLSRLVNIPYINADDFLTDEEKKKLINGTFTQEDRINKLKKIISDISKLLPQHPNIVAADSLPDTLSRKLLVDTYGHDITFIYVHAPRDIHLKRIQNRKGHFFTVDLLHNWIKTHWQTVAIPFITFKNIEEKTPIERRLIKIFRKTASKNKLKSNNG